MRIYQHATPIAFKDLALYLNKSTRIGPFYQRSQVHTRGAKKGLPTDDNCWYSKDQRRGQSTISGWLGQLCVQANIPVRTSHSSRHRVPTKMADAGFSEAAIMKQTNHRSAQSIRPYADATPHAYKKVANLIGNVTEEEDVELNLNLPPQKKEDKKRKCESGSEMQPHIKVFKGCDKVKIYGDVIINFNK